MIDVEVAQPGAEDAERLPSRARTPVGPPHRERSAERYRAKHAYPIGLLQLRAVADASIEALSQERQADSQQQTE